MANPLTPIAIANLKEPQRYEISDPGCSGLRVVVHPSRRKSFIVRFRFRGLPRKLTLGPCLTERGVAETDAAPENGTPLSLAAARELATKALREAKAGRDPCGAKKQQRLQALAAESDTLSAIAAEYLRREGPRLRTLNQRKADLDLICAKGLGRLPVGEISRGQFTRAFDAIADQNGLRRADRVLSAAKTLLSWHSARSDFVSPLVRGGRRVSTAEAARDRTLTEDELRAVWCAAERDNGPFGPLVQFLLLTAVRRGEAAGLVRGELSPDGKTWSIPGARYKSKRDVVIPLSAAAQKIIAAMPVLAGGDHIFSTSGAHALGSLSERKKALDAACGVHLWRIHDLRRTARTLLSRAGVLPDIAERCLGHAIIGVRKTYDRFEYLDEKRHAFEALAALIERIVHPPSDDVVVPIRKPSRRKSVGVA